MIENILTNYIPCLYGHFKYFPHKSGIIVGFILKNPYDGCIFNWIGELSVFLAVPVILKVMFELSIRGSGKILTELIVTYYFKKNNE